MSDRKPRIDALLKVCEPLVERLVKTYMARERERTVNSLLIAVMPILDEREKQLIDEQIAPLRRKLASLEMELDRTP